MRTARYTRISSDPDDTRLGVDRQAAECDAMADRLGWDVVLSFEDNDVSAYAGKSRPGYEALLEAIERGEVDAIIAWAVDRLHRNLSELERFIELCEKHQVVIQTCQAGALDLSSASGRMVARILGSVARHEVDHGRARMKAAHAQHAEDGRWRVYGQRAFGWEQGGTELRAEEADAIRDAADRILRGESLRSVVRNWTARGLTTSQGKAFSPLAVRRILTNGRAAGLSIHHGKVVGDGKWPTIITKEEHATLVAILTDASRQMNKRGAERRWQGSGVYLCGRCGSTMRSHSVAPKVKGEPGEKAYRCDTSPHLTRRQAALDEYVSELVVARLSREDAQLLIETAPEVDIPALQTERDNLQTRLNFLVTEFAEERLDHVAFGTGRDNLKPKIERLDAQIRAAREKDPIADLILAGPELAARWEDLDADVRGKVISRLLTVTVIPCPKGKRGFDPDFVGIDWVK